MKFADFSIQEISGALSVDDLKAQAENIVLFPNPTSSIVQLKNGNLNTYSSLELYDFVGRKVPIHNRLSNNTLEVSNLSKGLYFIVIKKDSITIKVLKCYIK